MSDTTGIRWGRWLMVLVIAGVVGVALLFFMSKTAFPEVRCEGAKHLASPDNASECYVCHLKATPKIAQNWYESKHGVMLVKCFVCHGQPDLSGAITYRKVPLAEETCRRCHAPSMQRMEARYGYKAANCNDCHPYHQNSIHHKAYEKATAKRTME